MKGVNGKMSGRDSGSGYRRTWYDYNCISKVSFWLEGRQKRLGSQLTMMTLGESKTKTTLAGKSLEVKALKGS